MTHMMNALESETGVPLLVRGSRGVRLTADGERMAPVMREMISAEERLEQELALTRGLERGRVRIGTFSSMSLRWLPEILELYQARYPGIEVELLEGSGLEMEQWLSGGRIDISYTSLQPHYSFDMIPFADDPMLAVLPRSHPMAGAALFPVDKFLGEPFIAYTDAASLDEDLARAMRLCGIGDIHPKFTSNFDQTIISLVAHNLGITIMPELIVRGCREEVATVPLSPPIYRQLGIALRSLKDASPAMLRLIACTREVLE